MSGKARTDITVLKMTSNGLQSLREKFEAFDETCMEYEDFIDDGETDDKEPYCDYIKLDSQGRCLTPIEKFKNVANKVRNIIKSYKSATFTELMMDLHGDKKKKKMLRENRKKNGMIPNLHLPPEERNEQAIIVVNSKIDMMMNIITQQQRTIDIMRNEIMGRFNDL